MKKYDPAKIEKKWQKVWSTKKVYKTGSELEGQSPKFYILDMFPYPSGEGLHVGHPKGYIATDIISRMKRMQGFNVLHPMGFDAFGLPAENYAIKTKTNPQVSVKKNVARYKKQLEILGLDYDWSREVNTTDPAFYKWTQWVFKKMYEKGLAYESFEPINWCPSCKTGLANEDVVDGHCERCDSLVEQKPLRQWVLKITEYADRLLADLDAVAEPPIPKVVDHVNPPQPGKSSVTRQAAHAIVYDPKSKKYLIIRNKKFGWDTVIIGGIEAGETARQAAEREVREETGYTDLKFVRTLGAPVEAHYFAKHKGENRISISTAVLFELQSDARVALAPGEDAQNEILWVPESEFAPPHMVNSELPEWLLRLKDPSRGFPKPLLDWPESIKESQRNWIGRSEGARLTFTLTHEVESAHSELHVFTTRPDTIAGVTYVVVAPEHALVKEYTARGGADAQAVSIYVQESLKKTERTRTEVAQKTGVVLKGVLAINPFTKKPVPVYVADYVLGSYGTGAVMAVPAHDERDFEFAQTYKLPIQTVVAPLYVDTTAQCTPKQDAPEVTRDVVLVIAKHWNNDSYLCLNWKVGWKTFITGGVESGEKPSDAAVRELVEETGYRNISKITEFQSPSISHFYHPGKKHNQKSTIHTVLVELKDGAQDPIELAKHSYEWVAKDAVQAFIESGKEAGDTRAYLHGWNLVTRGLGVYTGDGLLLDSGAFTGKEAFASRKEITQALGGTWEVKYRLKDWVFSRQRYWGEPFPILRGEDGSIQLVDEADLPVTLPKVKSYEPTGTGESPLAAIKKWVEVYVGKGKTKKLFKRETNTMPQWAGSSWYYLRYMDPKNNKALVDPAKEHYWNSVDLYVGGAEHATRHLIYARFWHKFLYDIGVVSTREPFTKLQSVGLIMGEDGRKMSKRFGNVVNPDEMVKTYGADTMRVYEMFMGPFADTIAWNTSGMVGVRRFLERIWGFVEKIEYTDAAVTLSPAVETKLHQTIVKVTSDIAEMKFNTAISALMIFTNALEAETKIPRKDFELLVKILAPFAPHMAEELWSMIGNKGQVVVAPWPVADTTKLLTDTVELVVQVQGKTRGTVSVKRGMSEQEVMEVIHTENNLSKWLAGKVVMRIIFRQDKLINVILKE